MQCVDIQPAMEAIQNATYFDAKKHIILKMRNSIAGKPLETGAFFIGIKFALLLCIMQESKKGVPI